MRNRLSLLVLLLASADSRTIKTRLLTNENGTKEIVPESDVPRREIDFLIQDLNHMNISVATTTAETPAMSAPEETTEINNRTELSENILMKHWNALTEVGWNEAYFRRPIRKMYVNNTRILQFGPVPTTELPAVLRDHTEPPSEEEEDLVEVTLSPRSKIARRIWSNEVDDEGKEEEEEVEELEEDTTDSTEVPENAEGDVAGGSKFVEAFRFVFDCAKDHSLQDGLLRCMATRVRSLLYPLWRKFDEGVDYYLDAFETCPQNATGHEVAGTDSKRTFYYRHRKYLYHVVFPLLVILLVKYLLVLPFLLFGMFAAKSLLFGLFSAGTATLHSLAKKYEYLVPRYPVKRYRQVQGVEVSPSASALYWSPQMPWSVPEDGRGLGAYENFSM